MDALQMPLPLSELVADFADALVEVDRSGVAHKAFQPEIGPFGEADAVRAALTKMQASKPARYAEARIKRVPDLLVPGEWAIEFKIVRPFGDNGKPAEHWSENVLHPYPGNTSSLGDCLKLLDSDFPERKCVIVFGFEHSPPLVPLEPALSSFELLAREVLRVHLGPRTHDLRAGLRHPVHQQVRVYGFEVEGFAARSA